MILVQRIRNFLSELDTIHGKSSLDLLDCQLYECIRIHFSTKESKDVLAESDLHFLKEVYRSRWEQICDSEKDYLHDLSELNRVWISLSKDLAPLIHHHSAQSAVGYLYLLIPSLEMDRDARYRTLFQHTQILTDFYLDYGGKRIFQKAALINHIVQSATFKLSAAKESDHYTKLSALTVDELLRLKISTDNEYVIKDERFKSIWSFLSTRVFTHLRDFGKIPIGLLPHMVELIDRYDLIKAQNGSFDKFRETLRAFFRRLYAYDVDDINHLYGMGIQYNSKKYLLLDLFIALYAAKQFSIDEEIAALSAWLVEFHPALAVSRKQLPKVATAGEPLIVISMSESILDRCCTILVSLLTTEFGSSLLSFKRSISVWDMTNSVFLEAETIHSKLLPLVSSNQTNEPSAIYGQIIREIIDPIIRSRASFLGKIFRDASVYIWLDRVKANKLADTGAYWLDPALLLSALLHTDSKNAKFVAQVNSFLDNLINTYAQDNTQNQLMKKLRVNILFARFFMQLSEHHKKYVITLIKISDVKLALAEFMNHCVLHINNQIEKLGGPLSPRTPHFFSEGRGLAKALPQVNLAEVKLVSELIGRYKLAYNQRGEAIERYLHQLGQPFLSQEEKDFARNCGYAPDTLGNFT